MEGWIKLHRKIIKWEWYKTPNMYHLFSHLLLTANHEDKKWQGITIKRGQLLTGRKTLSKETGISEQSIRTCMERLKSTNEITSKSTNQYSIITVCNYEEYQINEVSPNQQINQPANQQLTSKQPATNHYQEYKEGKEEEKNKERFVIPPSVKLVTLYCKERNNNISPREFIDFYESKGWLIGKNKMKDWQAAIRTWEKNDFNKEKTINNKKHPPIYDDHIKYIWDEEKQRYVHSVTKAVYIP